MFTTDINKQKELELYNEAIKALHKRERDILSSKNYVNSLKLEKLKTQGLLRLIKNRFDIMLDKAKHDKKLLFDRYKRLKDAKNYRDDTNYFCNDRIAVYTCIVGKYDSLIEPLVKPDNIDYYAITDFEIPPNSLWKRIDISTVPIITDYSNVLKNRYLKMNPQILFKNYKYSVYVDGNIKIYTDFTEHVNRISKYGFSHFKHSLRKSSYEEADACKLLRKDSFDAIDKYVEKLKKDNFPDNYGLLECSIIVREHNKKECINIMQQWWDEFKDNVKRDQIILPYILYKNGIKTDSVATLGANIDEDLSFEIVKHEVKK